MKTLTNFPVTQAKHGAFRYPPFDQYIGRSLKLYGQWCESEVDLFSQLVREGDTVVDAGANIGSYSVPLSKIVGPTGTLYAFEPQPVLSSLLSTNLIENNCTNARVLTIALGDETGSVTVPDFDYFKPKNFGGISFTGQRKRVQKTICAPLMKLDDVISPSRLRLMKIDVENMELQCLLGARNLITKFKPFIYMEFDREEFSKDILSLLQKWGYTCYLHTSRLYLKNNFKHNTDNVFGNTICRNLLCAPPKTEIAGLKKVSFPKA